MNIEHQKPPNWAEIEKHFPVKWNSGVIVTYGDKIYCETDIGQQKEAHESVHIRQQTKMGADKWWERYFKDSSFVLSQELEAYKEEVKWVRRHIKNRELRFKIIRQICLDFSSSIYNNVISYSDATKLFNLFQNQ